MSEARPKYWMGPAPTQCDLNSHHSHAITTDFVDGKTRRGPWANMCMTCHRQQGFGLGTGKGQHYRKTEVQGVMRWLKVRG